MSGMNKRSSKLAPGQTITLAIMVEIPSSDDLLVANAKGWLKASATRVAKVFDAKALDGGFHVAALDPLDFTGAFQVGYKFMVRKEEVPTGDQLV